MSGYSKLHRLKYAALKSIVSKRRSLLVATIIASMAMPTVVLPDTPPSQAGDLVAKLYNGAGGELFWTRSSDDRSVIGYEITRNGQSLGVHDVLSFYDSSLCADTQYIFTVKAIDNAGQRSSIASASVGDVTTLPTTISTPNVVVPVDPMMSAN